MLKGGCECGAVRYRLTGAPIFVNCCHCRQCQKVTGSAFAINAMIEANRVEVSSDARRLASEGGRTCCIDCGVLLWATHDMFGDAIVFVRVGTLDEGERLAPDADFFVRSKHPWVLIPEDRPCFEALPGEGDPPLFDDEANARIARARGG